MLELLIAFFVGVSFGGFLWDAANVDLINKVEDED